MDKGNLLIVEDDPLQRTLIKENLEREGHTVFESASGKEALEIIGEHPIDIAIIDYKLDGETGIEVIGKVLEHNPLITPIMVTAYGNVENAVEALKKPHQVAGAAQDVGHLANDILQLGVPRLLLEYVEAFHYAEPGIDHGGKLAAEHH